MSGLVVFWLIVIIGFSVVAYATVTAWRTSKPKGLDSEQRKELRMLREMTAEIESTAYLDRDVSPELSYKITDIIRKHKARELE